MFSRLVLIALMSSSLVGCAVSGSPIDEKAAASIAEPGVMLNALASDSGEKIVRHRIEFDYYVRSYLECALTDHGNLYCHAPPPTTVPKGVQVTAEQAQEYGFAKPTKINPSGVEVVDFDITYELRISFVTKSKVAMSVPMAMLGNIYAVDKDKSDMFWLRKYQAATEEINLKGFSVVGVRNGSYRLEDGRMMAPHMAYWGSGSSSQACRVDLNEAFKAECNPQMEMFVGLGAVRGWVQGGSSNGGTICMVNNVGDVYCRGGNASGNLGQGTRDGGLVHVPVKVNLPEATRFLFLASHNEVCAHTVADRTYCWGSLGHIESSREPEIVYGNNIYASPVEISTLRGLKLSAANDSSRDCVQTEEASPRVFCRVLASNGAMGGYEQKTFAVAAIALSSPKSQPLICALTQRGGVACEMRP